MGSFHSLRGIAFASSLLVLGSCSSTSNPSPGSPSGDGGGGGSGDGQASGSIGQPSSATLFSPAITAVSIEIDYEKGSAPYTGSTANVSDIWAISRDNVNRIFQKSPKTITLPTTQDAWQELDDISATTFTNDAILAIATAHRDQQNTASTATFYIVFLGGYWDNGSGAQKDILGLSLGSTGVIAMFKPVIASTAGVVPGTEEYVEQSTIVHEFGHAVGLVNNGLPMTSQHQDTAHGAHCTNQKCTMYYANEGSANATTFALNAFTGGSDIIFGDECLADIDAASQ